MPHKRSHAIDMSGSFTTHISEAIKPNSAATLQRSTSSCECQVNSPIMDLTESLPTRNRRQEVDGSIDTEDSIVLNTGLQQQNVSSCTSSSPLIQIVGPEDLPQDSPSLHAPSPISGHQRSMSQSRTLVKASFVYNENGELVDEKEARQHKTTDQLTTIQILRVIKKHYHHELRNKIGKILVLRSDGISSVSVDGIWKDRLSSWNFKPELQSGIIEAVSEDSQSVAGCHGPRRVLEIGCSDGVWCFNFKKELPDWIVTGVDDSNHWLCVQDPVRVEDFMAVTRDGLPTDCFTNLHRIQKHPEFTVRNLNCLQAHSNPIPHNVYEFIRARDIFDRIESYKSFLEDIRQMLKPNGVVEFFEIDPRPRAICLAKPAKEDNFHKSTAQTDWTDNIQDRFKDPLDGELATTTPGWTARVAERMKANIRPRDGVPAANLKSWLEGAGFWDVRQLIVPMPVGGTTDGGKLLKEFVKYQIELEDEIPKLREDLPKIEMSHLESGNYYLNLHVVTGQKPRSSRPGDLLSNGERQEMTASKYDTMARFNDAKSSPWKRFDLEGKLTSMMQNLTTLPGAPDTITVARSENDKAIFPMLGRHSNIESPFHAPPFVTVMMQNSKNLSVTEEVELSSP